MTSRLTLLAAALGLVLATGVANAAVPDTTHARHGAVANHGAVVKHGVVKSVTARRSIVAKPGAVAFTVASPGHHRLVASPRHERALWLARPRHHHLVVETTGIKTVRHAALSAWIARHAERRAERRIERRVERHAMNHQGVATAPIGVVR